MKDEFGWRYASKGVRHFSSKAGPFTRRDCWEIYAVIKGRMAPSVCVEKGIRLKEKTLWILPPEQERCWVGEGTVPASVVVFHFKKILPEIETQVRDHGHFQIALSMDEIRELKRMAADALPYFMTQEPLRAICSHRLMMSLGILVLRNSENQQMKQQDRVTQAEIFFDRHIDTRPDIRELAHVTGTSPDNLRRLFLIKRGENPKQALKRIQMNKASELLATTDLKVEALALECGFANVSSFCTAFKRHMGSTPHEYRTRESFKKSFCTLSLPLDPGCRRRESSLKVDG